MLILISSVLILGNLWFWIDKDGVRHYSNIAPPKGENAVKVSESEELSQSLRHSDPGRAHFMVSRVYDGDTIQVKGLDLKFTIRFVGIDSPEIGYDGRPTQPYAKEAKQYLAELVSGKQVGIKGYGTGGYNRQLAEVFVNGANINLEMVKSGLAEVYSGRLPKDLDSQAYWRAQKKARDSRKGMWQQGKSYVSPKKWRKLHPRK